MHSIKKQKGITLLEIMLAAGVIGTFAALLAVDQSKDYEMTRARVAVTQTNVVRDAAHKYITDNLATVLSHASSTNPYVISLGALKSAGYLPTGFSEKNSYGQTYCVLALVPTTVQVETMVVTEGGEEIPGLMLQSALSEAGAAGGMISGAAPDKIAGSGGIWERVLAPYNSASCSGTPVSAGHIAATLHFAQISDESDAALERVMTRVGTDSLQFTATDNYPKILATITSKFSAVDGSSTGYAEFDLTVNGESKGVIRTEVNVQKGGSKGYFWGFEKYAVKQVQFTSEVKKGDLVKVTFASGNLHMTSDIRIDLAP